METRRCFRMKEKYGELWPKAGAGLISPPLIPIFFDEIIDILPAVTVVVEEFVERGVGQLIDL